MASGANGTANGTARGTASLFSELGTTDPKRSFNGRRYDSYIPDLASGSRAYETYEKMTTDPVLGAALFAIENLIRQVPWRAQAFSQRPSDLKAASFLDECLEDMTHTWAEEQMDILSMLKHGFSTHEILYKKRDGDSQDPKKKSKFSDGLIGWRGFPIRAQDSVIGWIPDDSGDGYKAYQQQQQRDVVAIPMEKTLLFKTHPAKRSPEGESILRRAYRPWFFKRWMEETEGAGIERELVGLAHLMAPEGVDIWDEDDDDMVQLKRQALDLLHDVHANESEGVLTPHGWEFSLKSTGGRRSIEVGPVIERLEQRMTMTLLADFILIGHESVGSFALADAKTNLFAVAIGAFLGIMSDVMNRFAIPRLFSFNQRFPQDRLPMLVHGDIEAPDLVELADYITKLAATGVIIPGPELDRYVRRVANLPEPEEDERDDEETDAPAAQEANGTGAGGDSEGDGTGTQTGQRRVADGGGQTVSYPER